MTVTVMRTLDRLLGVPLCWMMGWLLRLRSRATATTPVKNILVIKFFGLGSVLLTSSSIRQMRTEHPGMHVTYLSFASNGALLDRCDSADLILLLDQRSPFQFFRDTVRVIRTIRRARFDAVIDFEFFSKFSTLLSALSGAPVRGGFNLPTRWRSTILTHTVPLDKYKHVVESFSALLAAVTGSATSWAPHSMRTTGEDRASVARRFAGNGHDRVVVNVNAGATFRERRWSPDRFSHLVNTLARRHGFTFVFIGSADEHRYVQSVIDRTEFPGRCMNTAGMLGLGELCVLLEQSLCFISNDSGPLHIAATLNTRVVALYGPESPTFYGPRSANATIVYKQISCSPCMNIYNAKQFHCPYNARCMDEISVEDVLCAFNHAVGVS